MKKFMFELAPDSSVSIDQLLDRMWQFKVLRTSGHLLVLPLQPVRDKRHRFVVPPERLASFNRRVMRLQPTPPGESQLERLPIADVPVRIQELSVQKDDPFAWRDLACGYRRKEIRRPLEAAIQHVGVEKVYSLILNVEGDWGVELMSFLDKALAAERKRRKDGRWVPDPKDWDYLLGDW